MAQVISPDDVQDVTVAPKQPATTAPISQPRTPPPGLGHAGYRAFVSTMAGLDQFASNVAGIVGKIPGTPHIKAFSKEAAGLAEKRRKELENDKAVPQTTGEKLVEGVGSAAGSAIPYLASEGPVGAFAVGATENANKGPWEALKGGARAAAFASAAKGINKGLSKAIEKAPVLKNAPTVVKRAAAGSATAAVLAPSGQRTAQAITGGLAGASQRESKSKNDIRAERLMAATGKTGGDALKAYKVAGPAMEETAKLSGKQPATVEELKSNVQETLGRLGDEYRQYLAPIKSQQVFATPIANAIENSIKEVEINGKTKEAEKIGLALQSRADEFKKQFTVGELDNLRELYFENLHGTSKEHLQERSSADVRADRVAEEAIKDMLYPMVDQQAQAAGKPAGYVRGTLKTQQANLIQLKDALIKRTKELSEKEGIRQGTPVMQRANITLAAHPGGGVVGSIHGLMNLLFGDPDSATQANNRVATSFPVTRFTGTRIGPVLQRAAPKQVTSNRVAAVAAGARSGDTEKPKTVKMRAPNGQVSDIPVDQVEHYKSRGARVVQ